MTKRERSTLRSRRHWSIPLLILLAIGFVTAVVTNPPRSKPASDISNVSGRTRPIAAARQPAPFAPGPVDLTGVPRMGRSSAQIAILEFADFECPFCRTFAISDLPRLKRDFVDSGTAAIYFMHFPMQEIHPLALAQSVGAACATRAGKFWPFHDDLFEIQKQAGQESVNAVATKIGLRQTEFAKCTVLDGPEDVKRDIAIAKSLRVTTTPTFFVGTIQGGRLLIKERLLGAPGAAKLDTIVRTLQRD